MADDTESPAPVPVKDVPEDLICAICRSVPLQPATVQQCEHFFCVGCIRKAIASSQGGYYGTPSFCPVCRLQHPRVQELRREGLVYRLWSAISVKCGHHEQGCAWQGSISDAGRHQREECPFGGQARRRVNELERELETLRLEYRQLQQRVRTYQRECEELPVLRGENFSRQSTITNLRERLQVLEKDERLKLPILFHGHYLFGREDVVQLSQLISQNVGDKPSVIDSNKIYNCVQSCNDYLKRNYADNPKHYRRNMRMLLSICAASTWFSDNQRQNIRTWLSGHGWS
mmetsp:Transcript_38283/g.93070  ORF Transcript_38283/g.93070 Transcript_38283/m.93070 type:complete len:288 (+) Transcript_38283:103-966(+)|eukprot:CAMPEP_0113503634 /NCGR_PEP_ID=MMETSP0014_2-20120614/34270_1 /TAXON_ID=2857 /ORGANISM="Nitzschia sp." /LENGTH=287 /DNA_ID=CAMNT_0000398657 /DNA_START=30 /DNA_END=893 /DNA_ORIENTATION=- /assembly_acc=CAM_ASM_000159